MPASPALADPIAPDPRFAALPPGPGGPSRRLVLAAIGLVAVALVAVGVWAAAGTDGGARSTWAGVPMDEPLATPPLVLTDTQGQPYDLRERTEGRVALLFFGFVRCPDICPTHLANVARALDQLPHDVSGQVDMVFVTTDVARDEPAVIREFLDQFDPRFEGLSGTQAEIEEAQRLAGVAVASQQALEDDREYRINHAGQVIAFSPDGVARLQYPFGTRQADWVRDLPRLVAGEHP